MFHFEIRMAIADKKSPVCRIDEFQLATLLRILKSRNRELFQIMNDFYDSVVEYDDAHR